MARKTHKASRNEGQLTLGLVQVGLDDAELEAQARERYYAEWAQQVSQRRSWLGYMDRMAREAYA